MRGIILAGGNGSRLWPVTLPVSKQLLPIFDKPMIYYPLATLMQANIRDVLVITRPQDAQAFRNILGDGSTLGMSITYAQQRSPDGVACAFLIGKTFLGGGDAPCTLILGDNLFHGDSLHGALHADPGFSGARIFAHQVSDPERYGVVEFDEHGAAIGLEEKPTNPRSAFAVTGLYIYDGSVVARAEALRPSPRGELEITNLNESYLDECSLEVRVLPSGTVWLDTGTFADLFDATAYVKTVEVRQGRKIACLEEIAWRNGWITDTELEGLAQPLMSSGYGKYLLEVVLESAPTLGGPHPGQSLL